MMAIFKPLLFCSHATSHKYDWILIDWLTALSCPCLVQREQSKEHSWSRRFLFSPSGELYRDCLYICILILVYNFFSDACCYWFTWIVIDVFVIDRLLMRSLLLHSCYLSLSRSWSFFLQICLLFSCEMLLGRFCLRKNKQQHYKRFREGEVINICLHENSSDFLLCHIKGKAEQPTS